MNAEDYVSVIKRVSAELDVPVTDPTLIRNVSWYCNGLDFRSMTYPNKDARNAAVASMYTASLAKPPLSEAPFDFEAYARSVGQRSDTIASTPHVEFSLLTAWISQHMPTVASKAMSVYIDSRSRKKLSGTEDSIADFEFRVSPRHTQVVEVDGHVVANEIPTMVTYFKIPRIMLPYNAELRQRNCTNEITLTFTGLRSNGILSHEDTYHFVFSYDPTKHPDSPMVELIPVNDYCKFSPPLRVVEDLTLRFNDPVYPIAFAPDRLRPVSFNYNSTEGRIVFGVPHGLSSGDVIAISNLSTRDDAANGEFLSQINDPRGIIISEIDTFIIATNINFSRLKSPENTSLPWVIIISRTFRFPLEIGYQGGD